MNAGVNWERKKVNEFNWERKKVNEVNWERKKVNGSLIRKKIVQSKVQKGLGKKRLFPNQK